MSPNSYAVVQGNNSVLSKKQTCTLTDLCMMDMQVFLLLAETGQKKVLGLMGGRQFLLHDYKKQRQTIFEKKNLDF